MTKIDSTIDRATDKLQGKVRQLYAFLKEANQIQFRPIRVLKDQPYVIRLSDMPQHPSASLNRPTTVSQISEVPDVLIRVARPKITKCPAPPSSCSEWLLGGWDDPNIVPEVAESKNQRVIEIDNKGNEVETTKTEHFNDERTRVEHYNSWRLIREKWVEPELIARKALSYFDSIYTLYAKLEKEREKLELLIADGVLSWRATSAIDGPVIIQHPLLFKRVELRFNPKTPEFTIHETEREVELYTTLFLDLGEVDSKSIRTRKDELEDSSYHPLGWDDTAAFLKSIAITISPTEGEYLNEPSASVTAQPKIWRDPVLLLRNRSAGISNAVDKILDHIDSRPAFPPALSQITGEEVEWAANSLSPTDVGVSTTVPNHRHTASDLKEKQILLVNEANHEQLEIVKRLERSGSVVVQGPPGTGKTHTISNLIGHLLSQGKSILVTAHTVKALRVLRDKVPDMLKPLCVSVLGSDQLARRQLESAVSSITERLTSETYDGLVKKGLRYEQERDELTRRELSLKHLLREAIENEYRPIDVNGRQYSPSEAARLVAQNRQDNDWIPSPISASANIGTAISAVERLYVLGALFTSQEESDARLKLPKEPDLVSEEVFHLQVSEYAGLLTQDLTEGAEKWIEYDRRSEALGVLLEKVQIEFNDELLSQAWRPYAIVAGIHGGLDREVWEALVSKIESAVESSARYSLTLQHRATLCEGIPVGNQLMILTQICAHLEEGRKINFIQLAPKPDWRRLIKGARVAAGAPSHLEHFRALRQLAELLAKRQELSELWNERIGSRVGRLFDQLGSNPENSCRGVHPEVKRCLNWSQSVWEPLAATLKANGLKLDEILGALPRDTSEIAEYVVIERFVKSKLIVLLEKEIARARLREIDAAFESQTRSLVAVDPSNSDSGCIGRFRVALENKDVSAYSEALKYLRRLDSIKPLVHERDRLLADLKSIAPSWAMLLSNREVPHDKGVAPGNIVNGWLWRQLCDVLNERSKLDPEEIQAEIDSVAEMLREVTRLLVDARAWAEQLRRLEANNSMRQALVGWLDTAKRLASTRQMDKRLSLLSESRKLMRSCSQAVPVWIMPISIMAENFDPQTTKFDVVIIDEASQADINALIPLYMGKQIIVVGDHEQVTPLGVGKDQTVLENLRKTMLKEIPNAHLYDSMSSIYDLARQSFGEGVRLVEHFRCVPQIISFSNALSYEGKIRALREASATTLKPSCVPFRVKGIRDGDVNRIEAEQIVALINAMIRHEAYKGKTIGVISMLGESQAALIQSMIQKEISSVEIDSRRIQAGISAEFQGDERDVIFLSMVDSAIDSNPLRATGDGAFEQTKKRYNVAVSRARDQIWVIHSFDPDLHLKVTDLRYRLLQHVRDPDSSVRNFEQEVGRTESPFEKEVLRRLTSAGFKVKTQVEVGYFRIDMVVEGVGKRLAVECDGDRYHPLEKLAEDMSRQAILERLGWKFVRIRGSAFYRDPNHAMSTVFKRLAELEIHPIANGDRDKSGGERVLIDQLQEIMRNGFEEEAFSGNEVVEQHTEVTCVTGANQTVAEQIAHSRQQSPLGPPQELEGEHDARNSRVSPPDSETVVARISSGSNALGDYTHYDGTPCRDPRVTKQSLVASDLLKIIDAEGPIQVKRAFDIYLRSCGIKRMGHEIKAMMVGALSSLVRSKSIKSHNYTNNLDVLCDVVWRYHDNAEKVRCRGDRSLDEIPMGELFAIATGVLGSHQSHQVREEDLRRVLEVLELRRLTTNAEDLLKQAILGNFTRVDVS